MRTRRFSFTGPRPFTPGAWSRELLPEAMQLGRMLGIYGLLGVIAGLVALVFVTVVHYTGQFVLLGATGVDPMGALDATLSWPTGQRWWLLLIPAGGFLISGLLSAFFAPETMGTGTGGVIDAYHRNGGVIRRRVPFIKMLASAATIGSGGSAGVEGPVGYIASGLGSSLGRLFKLSPNERRILVMAGFAAGIAAVFHAPMATSVFAAEVLYRDLDLEHEVLVPSIIASTLAYAVFGAVHGWDPIWTLPPVSFSGVIELLPYLFLAVVCAIAGRLFIAMEHGVHHLATRNERVPRWVPVMLGGLLLGVIGLFVPQAIGVGLGVTQLAINGQTGVVVLLVFAIAKMATSALTAGSGGSGGLFAPSLAIGGVLGGAVAVATNAVFPGLGVDTAAFTVVGMAGFFAAVINAPISTVIMVSELAGSYRLLVPTLWVCIIAWFAARKWTLYREQVSNRMAAPGHVAAMMAAVLHHIRVRDAMEPGKPAPITVTPDIKLRDLVHDFARSVQGVFPIIDPDDGRLLGVVDGWALRQTIGEEGINDILVAADFLAPALTASPDERLDSVVRKMFRAAYDEVLVVNDDESAALVGVLSRREIVSSYYREMLVSAAAQAATEEGEGAPLVRPQPEGDGAQPTAPARKFATLDLAAALQRGGVVHALRGLSREEALEELVERAELPAGLNRVRLLEQLLEREQLGSTYIGDGVAFPHPAAGQGFDIALPIICVATPRKPVIWGEADEGGEPPRADIIVMLLAPPGKGHLTLLRGVAKALQDPSLRREIHKHAPLRHLASRFEELGH